MASDRFTAIVRSSGLNADKPFELCVDISTADGQARLEHEDYLVTRDELIRLRNELNRVIGDA